MTARSSYLSLSVSGKFQGKFIDMLGLTPMDLTLQLHCTADTMENECGLDIAKPKGSTSKIQNSQEGNQGNHYTEASL